MRADNDLLRETVSTGEKKSRLFVGIFAGNRPYTNDERVMAWVRRSHNHCKNGSRITGIRL